MAPHSPDRPTVITVAKEAGVSIASVSRVLNGIPTSQTVAERVQEATRRLGYVPAAAARSLKAGRTYQLAFAVPDISNPVYVEVMRAIEGATKGSGFRLLVHSTGSDVADELDLLESLRRRYVDGLVMTSLRMSDAHLRAIEAAAVPVVVIGNAQDDFPIDSVRTSSKKAVELAVDHLLESGRKKIGFINGPLDTGPGRARGEGFVDALAGAGLEDDLCRVEVGEDFTHHAGYEATRRLLERWSLDGLLCANDLIAFGALRALAEAGIAVPSDTAVVGIDDTDLAAMVTPSLSSVSLGAGERGRLAAKLLLERLADLSLPPRRFEVEPKLVIRESSAR